MAICQNVALSSGHGNRDPLDLWICEKIIHLSKTKKGKSSVKPRSDVDAAAAAGTTVKL